MNVASVFFCRITFFWRCWCTFLSILLGSGGKILKRNPYLCCKSLFSPFGKLVIKEVSVLDVFVFNFDEDAVRNVFVVVLCKIFTGSELLKQGFNRS